MGENSKISWTDHTFNPWIGCTRVGPGCDHCYAEALNGRFGHENWGQGVDRRRTAESNWAQPRKWNRRAESDGVRRRVFCASMADVFDNAVAEQWRADLFQLIRETPFLDWILLTKRVGNVAAMLPEGWDGWPNIWLLITVVNQEEADRDIPKLLRIPARIRGLSIEPQLGVVRVPGGLDWVITCAESGFGRRPYQENWARLLRDDCAMRGTAFFYKQRFEGRAKIETPVLDGRRWRQFP